ncbi:MAG: TetR/AcrR family transcriptional regulator [Kofleriaceae bacterium]
MRTRAALVTAAVHEFTERGYAATTARSIAARATAATGSFYQYFTSKDEVLREVAGTRQALLTERVLGLVEGDRLDVDQARGRLREVIDVVVAAHVADGALHAVITERRHADPALDALIRAGERRLLDRITAVLGRWAHPDPAATAFIVMAALEGAVHAHVLGQPVVSDARFIDALADALVRIALPATASPATSHLVAPETPWPSSS